MSEQPTSLLTYRPDIDGLRAIAVLAVLVFHLDANWLPGGFLGVDVFFVISGYLITMKIKSQLEEGSFSIAQFWQKRIKRLYPALTFMVCITMLAAALLKTDPGLRHIPMQAIASLLSFQNIHLWLSTEGYWSTEAESLALLHVWSLSLEEQFYFIYPLLLILLHRYSPKRQFICLAALLSLSLITCILLTPKDKSAAFYLLPARMWELLIGGLLAFKPPSTSVTSGSNDSPKWHVIHLTGSLLLLAPFFVVENNPGFPGYQPVFTCLGTALLIHTGSHQSLLRKLLIQPPVIYLGKISYSLYLWHWPVIIFLGIVQVHVNAWLATGLSIGLAAISYHLIETPLRYQFKRPRLTIAMAALLVGVSSLALQFKINSLPNKSEDKLARARMNQLKRRKKQEARKRFLEIADKQINEMIKTTDQSTLYIKDLGNIDDVESYYFGNRYETSHYITEDQPGRLIIANEAANQDIKKLTHEPDILIIGSSHATAIAQPFEDYAKKHQISLMLMTTGDIEIAGEEPTAKERDIQRLKLKHLSKLRPTISIIAGKWNKIYQDPTFHSSFKYAVNLISQRSSMTIVLGQVPSLNVPNEQVRRFLKAQMRSYGAARLEQYEDVNFVNRKIESFLTDIHDKNGRPLRFINPYPIFIDEIGRPQIIQDGIYLYGDDDHVNSYGADLIFTVLLESHLNEIFHITPSTSKFDQD